MQNAMEPKEIKKTKRLTKYAKKNRTKRNQTSNFRSSPPKF